MLCMGRAPYVVYGRAPYVVYGSCLYQAYVVYGLPIDLVAHCHHTSCPYDVTSCPYDGGTVVPPMFCMGYMYRPSCPYDPPPFVIWGFRPITRILFLHGGKWGPHLDLNHACPMFCTVLNILTQYPLMCVQVRTCTTRLRPHRTGAWLPVLHWAQAAQCSPSTTAKLQNTRILQLSYVAAGVT